MAKNVPQNFANHRRFVPLYHFVIFAVFAVNVIWSIVQLVRVPSWTTGLKLAVAASILILYFYTRFFSLPVSDRLIRLEMRLRLKYVLPPALQSRILEFDKDQPIALRFASEAELPDLG